MHIITPTPPSAANVSHTLMLRHRARAAAARTERLTGLPLDATSIERVVVNVYRATGSRAEGVRALWNIVDALKAHAAEQGGGESA